MKYEIPIDRRARQIYINHFVGGASRDAFVEKMHGWAEITMSDARYAKLYGRPEEVRNLAGLARAYVRAANLCRRDA